MSVILKVGMYGRTGSGGKVGPFSYDASANVFYVDRKLGQWSAFGNTLCPNADRIGAIVSEWNETTEGPVRTVTSREIVLGTYDRIIVTGVNSGRLVSLDIYGRGLSGFAMNASELRSAAMIFSQLAEALDDNADKEKE